MLRTCGYDYGALTANRALGMESRTRSVRAEQMQLSQAMRGNGCSWRQVADEFVKRWGLTYLQAFRLAHGWSQEEAAKALIIASGLQKGR